MRVPAKTVVVTLISCVTFALGAAPATATELADQHHTHHPAQKLNTNNDNTGKETNQPVISVDQLSGTRHNFNVETTIALAESEIGTSRPTGWGQPGECIMSAHRWIRAGGGNWDMNGANPVTNYANAIRLPFTAVQRGDIIQYESIKYPTSWVSGVHTLLVTEVHENGTLTIIESNNPGGSGLVSQNKQWTPQPPQGFQAVVWRF